MAYVGYIPGLWIDQIMRIIQMWQTKRAMSDMHIKFGQNNSQLHHQAPVQRFF
jgi:hypothetical protein